MTKKYLIIQLILFFGTNLQAAMWPMNSIVQLIIQSDTVVEASYLKTVDNECTFLIQDIAKHNTKVDTLVLKDLNNYFYNLNEIEKADRVILFLSNRNSNAWYYTGIILLIDNNIYHPIQNINPGPYSFGSRRDTYYLE